MKTILIQHEKICFMILSGFDQILGSILKTKQKMGFFNSLLQQLGGDFITLSDKITLCQK